MPSPHTLVVVGLGVAAIAGVIWGANKDKTDVKPDEDACDCFNIEVMLAREHIAEAAIESIDRQMKQQAATDANATYSDALYKKGRDVNQARVSIAAEGDPYTGAGETDPWNCKTNVSKGTSGCMKASLQAHENVHHNACLKVNNRFRDYRSDMKMTEYWEEDRAGYQAELEYLKRNRGPAIKRCPPLTNYPGAQSKEEQQQRLAASKRRTTKYAAGLPS